MLRDRRPETEEAQTLEWKNFPILRLDQTLGWKDDHKFRCNNCTNISFGDEDPSMGAD